MTHGILWRCGLLPAVLLVTGLLVLSGCATKPALAPESLYGIWMLEHDPGKPVTTIIIFWPRYFTQLTGKGKLARPTTKIRYTMEWSDDRIVAQSVWRPSDPPYELGQDMVLRQTWPNAATFTSRGHFRYTKITAVEANKILRTWKIESVDPKQLEIMPSGEE